jgi:vacuolar-type H+-ATPase subunit F/Vma7
MTTCSCGAKFKTAQGQRCHATFMKDNKDHVVMPLMTTRRIHRAKPTPVHCVALTVEEELKQTLQRIEDKIIVCQDTIDQLKSYHDEMRQLERERTIVSVALEQLTKEREELTKRYYSEQTEEALACETT